MLSLVIKALTDAEVIELGWIQLTDKITDLGEDSSLEDAITSLTDQSTAVMEMVIWGQLRGGTQVYYANGTARTAVNTPLDASLVEAAVNQLKRNWAEKMTTRLKAGPGFATEPVNSSFGMAAHVDLEHDIRACDGFVPVEKYASLGMLIDDEAEIGKLAECRVILTPMAVPFTDAGGAAGGMRSTSGTSADVYPVVIFGKDAYGTVPLKGANGVEFGVNNAKIAANGYDPLGQRPFVAWKIWFQAVRLNESWMVRLEVAATQLS